MGIARRFLQWNCCIRRRYQSAGSDRYINRLLKIKRKFCPVVVESGKIHDNLISTTFIGLYDPFCMHLFNNFMKQWNPIKHNHSYSHSQCE
mmetsp:Transcript_12173/g.14849  ORF Transcript_12173/g.14849 Transcript_12173/m.14849 type:complete len:91 (-) Transcript_12173:244-516(-)